MTDKNKTVSDTEKRQKHSFYRHEGTVIIQVILWVFVAAVLLIIGLAEKEYSLTHRKEYALLFLFCEMAVSVPVPLTFLRVTFCDRYVKEKALFFTVKRLAKEEIRQIGIFEKSAGRTQVRQVFFSEKCRNVNEINRCFERGRNRDIIFLSYPQKGLENTLKEVFPDRFDEKNTFVFSE